MEHFKDKYVVLFNEEGWGVLYAPLPLPSYWYHIPCRQIVKANDSSVCCEKCKKYLSSKSIKKLYKLIDFTGLFEK